MWTNRDFIHNRDTVAVCGRKMKMTAHPHTSFLNSLTLNTASSSTYAVRVESFQCLPVFKPTTRIQHIYRYVWPAFFRWIARTHTAWEWCDNPWRPPSTPHSRVIAVQITRYNSNGAGTCLQEYAFVRIRISARIEYPTKTSPARGP